MLTLYISELKRRWSLMKAYPGEEVIGTLMLAFFFYMLFLGASYIAGPTAQFGDRLDSIVVGYVVWLLMMQTYAGIAHDLQSESTTGTLEQLLTTPFGISHIFLMRSLADVSFSFFVTVLVAFVIMLLTGSQLHLSPWMLIPIVSVILASTGLGFLVGSLVFVMKQIRSVLMICQFALLFAVMVPMEKWGMAGKLLGSLMPVAPGSAALRTILVSQSPDMLMIGLSVANAVVYLLLGMWVFKRVEQVAKRRGIVSTY